MCKNILVRFLIFFAIVGVCSCTENKTTNTNKQAENVATTEEISHPQLDILTKRIGEEPENAELYFTRATVHEGLKNYESAALDYEKAIDLNPREPANYLRAANMLKETKNIVPAINVLSKGLENLPSNAAINREIGLLYLYINDPQKTILSANRALKISENDAEAYHLKGLAYVQLQDTMKAISTFQTAVEQDPDFYDPYMQLGVLCAGKNLKFAEDYYKNAIRIDSLSTEAWYGLGMFYQNKNDWQKAKDTYRKLIFIDRNFINAYYNTGYLYFQEDSIGKAIKEFDISVKVQPGFARGYYMRGLCFEVLENLDEARKDYNRTLSLDADFELAQIGLERVSK